MISFFTRNLIWSQAPYLLAVCLVIALLSYVWAPFFYIGLVGAVFCFYFFRNPERSCPQALGDPFLVISPADGKVVAVTKNNISLFLSPFDVHVNWIPVSGVITEINYHKGTFVPAFLPKSSFYNERNDVLIRTNYGKTIVVRQIAGTIARVIRWWVNPNQEVAQGYKYGMIMFGSRVELILPDKFTSLVKVGERVTGGQTILGRLF